MNISKTLLAAVSLTASLLTATGAHAALESRLGGLAVYDTDLNITWLADANANGAMTWSQANAWATQLNVIGITGWRLPTTLQPDASCGGQYNAGGSFGIQSSSYGCTGSEMGHLFYTELGSIAGRFVSIGANHAAVALFSNFQSYDYWSGTTYAPIPDNAWYFHMSIGYQAPSYKTYSFYAMAVHPGDVEHPSSVPVPAAAWLLGSGLLGLAGIARKRKAA